MQDEQYIIDALGIADWPEDRREPVLDEATMRVGEAITGSLDEQQFNEYKAIVDNDGAVIDAWLTQHVPDYKDNAVYKEIEAGFESDPEKNSPEKLFVSLAWMQVNVPDLQDRIDKALTAYKQELA